MKIICIGRNYINHVKELNHSIPTVPLFFLKPETALILRNRPFFYPEFSKNIHFETEIVLKINKVGRHIQEKFAHTYYDEIGIGIDFTARDLQNECIKSGNPWEISKAFDYSAPIGKFIPKSEFSDLNNINFSLLINNEIKQKGNTKNMIFSFDRIISYVSQFLMLKIGDLVFTGTPAGVGPVKIGDRLEAFIDDRKLLDFKIK
ncbi:MAG: fumarylacetoacetate hydrolase family protein [Bacteroidales bacterium]|nr:fumarylacetoacetate hydrolase family protein [Bacteroidales bacterium]